MVLLLLGIERNSAGGFGEAVKAEEQVACGVEMCVEY